MTRSAHAVGSLPAEVTQLVGRRAEAADVRSLLAKSRLVTLTGPGGVGKTRLSLHVAKVVRSAFRDGVWMVELAELSQPDLIASMVLAKIRATGTGLGDLVEFLAGRRALLVLDNCEHLVDAAAELVAELLVRCPELHVLATSRSALRVEGEVLFAVPPLSVPPAGPDGAAAADPRGYDAVALFLERAAALTGGPIEPAFDEAMVARLCRELDGIPLAIELAASSSRWLPLDALVDRASPELASIGSTRRSVPERQRSLRSSLDYSHELCSEPARTLWARLSVFRGGADLEAVRAVCVGDGLDLSEVPGALFELVDKSILTLTGSRYQMLETIRAYGADRLGEGDALREVRRRHLSYFSGLADIDERWFGPGQAALFGRIRDEQANLRAAFELCLEDPVLLTDGLLMASRLWSFWIGVGLPGEGRHWLAQLLDASPGETPGRALAAGTCAFLAVVDGDIPRAHELIEECLAAEQVDAETQARAASARGMAALFSGGIDGAPLLLEEALQRHRERAPGSGNEVEALIALGLSLTYTGALDRARSILEDARALCVRHEEDMLHSWVLAILGLVNLLEGVPAEAEPLLKEALARKRAIDNKQGLIWAVEFLAWTALERGDGERAAMLLGACEARAEQFGPYLHGFLGLRTWHDERVRLTRLALVDRYDAIAATGRRLSLDDLISTALEERAVQEAAPGQEGTGGWAEALPLTRREREIAALIAVGRTNKEIAADLVIAPRTVDSHVQHILTKLGFTSRAQVAALVASQPRQEP